MPYIKQEGRDPLDERLKPLVDFLKELPEVDQDGCVNYTVTKLLHKVYPRSYRHMNRALGVLEAIKLEFYRRIVAPYETEKIEENGDV